MSHTFETITWIGSPEHVHHVVYRSPEGETLFEHKIPGDETLPPDRHAIEVGRAHARDLLEEPDRSPCYVRFRPHPLGGIAVMYVRDEEDVVAILRWRDGTDPEEIPTSLVREGYLVARRKLAAREETEAAIVALPQEEYERVLATLDPLARRRVEAKAAAFLDEPEPETAPETGAPS